LGERFWHSKSFRKSGILCVLRTFGSELLWQKIHSNPKRVVFRGAHKYQITQECGIQIDMTVNNLSELVIESNYLVVLMSNLLGNAIEACAKLDGNKRIHCSIVQKDALFISVRNTSLPVTIVGNGIPTAKEHKRDHGYGIPHIQQIVGLLGGEYAFSYEDGWFEFAIEIPSTDSVTG